MQNPLAKFVGVEDREDGVYIKVTRKQRDTITVHELIRALQAALVTNFDLRKIEEVVKRARGGFERIGPPFEYYNTALDEYVQVRTEPQAASMQFSSLALTQGIRPTKSSLLFCLHRKGVKYGIVREAVDAFVAEPTYDTEIEIAKGMPPQDGHDGATEILVRISPDARPSIGANGKVDFRSIRSFTAVTKGQPLVRKSPPEEGEPGITVTGEEIPAKAGKEVELPQGKNTEISEDGLVLLASTTGVVYEENDRLHIGELLQIEGDVDYKVGNIKYSGDVFIKGSVKPGFTVESEGDIYIGGEIESARVVSRNGTVDVGRGVIGKNDTHISGKVGVRVGFAQEAVIISEGTVTIDKHCLHCTITCHALETSQSDSSIVGGEVRAYGYLAVANLGNEGAVHTKVVLVNKQKLQAQEKINELRELKAKMQKGMQPLAKDLRSKSAIIKKAGAAVGDRHRLELKKLVEEYNVQGKKVEYVENKITELEQMLDSDMGTDGYVKVIRDIHPGTEIDLYGVAQRGIKAKMTAKVFRAEAGSIQTEG
ncbi:MAG: DUF342 domain-containing protein [Chitinivibrionales bacterium]|nr:DUF342 domain-containing protein [Chitinivibrionales bacterium]MBD3356800.1 DUF342 domain-containing protein [Chitinivibrionales bacterium]